MYFFYFRKVLKGKLCQFLSFLNPVFNIFEGNFVHLIVFSCAFSFITNETASRFLFIFLCDHLKFLPVPVHHYGIYRFKMVSKWHYCLAQTYHLLQSFLRQSQNKICYCDWPNNNDNNDNNDDDWNGWNNNWNN